MEYHGTLRRTAAIAVLCVSGAVAAFAAIAPSPLGELLPASVPVVETLPLRAAQRVQSAPDFYIREEDRKSVV